MAGQPYNTCPVCGRRLTIGQSLFHWMPYAIRCKGCDTRLATGLNPVLIVLMVFGVILELSGRERFWSHLPRYTWLNSPPVWLALAACVAAAAVYSLTLTTVRRADASDKDPPPPDPADEMRDRPPPLDPPYWADKTKPWPKDESP